MRHTHTLIVGGGQAGLALSRSLTDRGVEHVVLERGRIGERWRSERWDSLRLLTPRWQSRLPGWRYEGPGADGYMGKDELVTYLERYASSFDAPVRTGVSVTAVRPDGGGFVVDTDELRWHAKNVVIATGDCQRAHVPELAGRLSPDVLQVVPTRYRNPEQLPQGGVLVVGASSTGLQLAAEIHRSGRPGGRDIMAWLDVMGVLDERAEDVGDLEASRAQPSLQLVGTPDRATLDLRTVRDLGIRLVGRTRDARGGTVSFDDNLVEDAVAADLKLVRLLKRIDAYIEDTGLVDACPSEPIPPMTAVDDGPACLDLHRTGIRSVLWATGFARSYPWLHVPVLDARGEILHEGGVTAHSGLYVMGLRFLRRRASSFIDGQARDAEELADHILAHRGQPALARALT
jgi:putative flavoprotein involved in K+ transport